MKTDATRLLAAAKQAHDEAADHFLYRCYDAQDELLYIGCTTDIEGRMGLHVSAYVNRFRSRVPQTSVELVSRMVRYEVSDPIKGRQAARAAEKAAIQGELPVLNVVHNRRSAS